MKQKITLDRSGLVIGLFVAIIVVFQQLAVLILEHLFTIYLKMGIFEAKLTAYIFSIFVLFYYINKSLKHSKR